MPWEFSGSLVLLDQVHPVHQYCQYVRSCTKQSLNQKWIEALKPELKFSVTQISLGMPIRETLLLDGGGVGWWSYLLTSMPFQTADLFFFLQLSECTLRGCAGRCGCLLLVGS